MIVWLAHEIFIVEYPEIGCGIPIVIGALILGVWLFKMGGPIGGIGFLLILFAIFMVWAIINSFRDEWRKR